MNAPITHFTILLGGDVVVTDRLRRQIAGSRVIGADSGMRHAEKLGLRPELWTGDFDSASQRLRSDFSEVEREVHNPEKDMTDGEIAIEAALSRGATKLALVGAFGGARTDHGFLHLALAIRLAEAGVDVLLSSGTKEGVPLLRRPRKLDFCPGTLFSILAMTPLQGLTLSGAKWPLEKRDVPFGSSLTISNEVTGDFSASLDGGRAVLLAHPVGPT